jgi:phenylacetic acid degradation operon negative regulatory protein
MGVDSTRTIIFGIFVLAGRKLTATQVIALARPLGISATNVKSHLTRMVGDGALKRSGPVRAAQYWPSSSQALVIKGIVTRLQGHRGRSWDGRWIVLILQMPSNRMQQSQLRAALWFDGFRPCAPTTFVRPEWPRHWALSRARQYLARTRGLCLCGALVGPMDAIDVNALYDLDSFDREARRLAHRISKRRIKTRLSADAFAVRLEVGGLVARLAGHDPRLPPALWGRRRGMHDLVRAFHRFEARIAPMAQRFLDDVSKPRSP